MSMIVKTYIHEAGSTRTLQNYLLRGKDGSERILGADYSKRINNIEFWGREFDEERKLYNKDTGRRAYHFVLSPAPEEKATLEEVRQSAIEWVETNCPTNKWVINYHNDNGILHAHIAVNAVKMDGKKIHFDENEWAELANSAHKIAKENGLNNVPIQDVLTPKERWQQHQKEQTTQQKAQRYKRKYAEQRMRENGFKSIKDHIRESINDSKTQAKAWREFEALLRMKGIEARQNKQGGITYCLTNPVMIRGREVNNFAVKDYKLGTDNNPDAYIQDEIVKGFIFVGSEVLQDSASTAVKARAVIIKTLPPRPKAERRDYSLPKELNKYTTATYHGRLTRRALKNARDNAQAILDSLQVVRENKVNSADELLKLNNEANKKIAQLENTYEQVNEELKRLYMIVIAMRNAIDPENDKQNRKENKKFLREHKVSTRDLSKYEQQAKELSAYARSIEKETDALYKANEERENAYMIVTEARELQDPFMKVRQAGFGETSHKASTRRRHTQPKPLVEYSFNELKDNEIKRVKSNQYSSLYSIKKNLEEIAERKTRNIKQQEKRSATVSIKRKERLLPTALAQHAREQAVLEATKNQQNKRDNKWQH